MKQIVDLKSGGFELCIRWIGAGVCGLCVALIFGCRALDHTSLLLSSERSYFRNLIAQSAFQNSLDSVHISGKSYPYDSLLVSVLASVQSRQGRLFHFREAILPAVTSLYSECPLSFKAYVRLVDVTQPTLVILPGSFSSWKSGAHSRQTMTTLLDLNPHANLVVFDGFMSPVFLQTSCRSLPLNISLLAEDLYSRLENFFDSLGLLEQGAGEIGLVGFSGGGRVALELMILDGQSSVPLYKLGAFAASPILNQRLTFDLLDDAFAPDTGGLTTMPYALSVAYHMVPSILRGAWGVLPEHIYALYKKNPPNFRQRVWNEFITVDLKDALAAVGIAHGDLSDSLSWRSAYEHITSKSLDSSESCLTPEPLDARLDYISQRTVVVFSHDDPFLSDIKQKGRETSCAGKVLDAMQHSAHLYVYEPELGAHLGIFIDPLFSKLLAFSFF